MIISTVKTSDIKLYKTFIEKRFYIRKTIKGIRISPLADIIELKKRLNITFNKSTNCILRIKGIRISRLADIIEFKKGLNITFN